MALFPLGGVLRGLAQRHPDLSGLIRTLTHVPINLFKDRGWARAKKKNGGGRPVFGAANEHIYLPFQ